MFQVLRLDRQMRRLRAQELVDENHSLYLRSNHPMLLQFLPPQDSLLPSDSDSVPA